MQHLKTHGGSKTISKQNPKIVNLLYFTRYKAESPSYVLSLIPYGLVCHYRFRVGGGWTDGRKVI